MGDSEVLEKHIPVIHARITHFGANVSNHNPIQWSICLHVSDLHHKLVRAV